MKWRFTAVLMIVALIVVLVQDIPLSAQLRVIERDRIITSLERDAFVLAGRSEESLESGTSTGHSAIMDLARQYRAAGGARVVIVDSAGIALVTSDDDSTAVGSSYLSRPEIATALNGQVTTGERYSKTLDEQVLYVSVPVFGGPKIQGAVRLTYPAQFVVDSLNQRLFTLWLVALTTVLIAGIVGLVLSTSITRALKRLKETTEHLAEGRLHVRADDRTGAPELRSLSRSFNIMAERLDALLEQQRTFASNASHQLRTPLTALRLRLESARDLIDSDPRGAEDRLLTAEAEADRLGDIIEGLLLLSRTESSSAPVETVDLAVIAGERVDHWRPLAQESGVTISYEGPASAAVLAVSTAAEQIIDNYIDNALTVSERGGSIIVRLSGDGRWTSLHVLDEGPGMSPEQTEQAFDRFWRGSADGAGNGLGLAIVAQLASASGATVRLTNRPDGGIDASARFADAP
jgi:signal transduction histidine kinase